MQGSCKEKTFKALKVWNFYFEHKKPGKFLAQAENSIQNYESESLDICVPMRILAYMKNCGLVCENLKQKKSTQGSATFNLLQKVTVVFRYNSEFCGLYYGQVIRSVLTTPKSLNQKNKLIIWWILRTKKLLKQSRKCFLKGELLSFLCKNSEISVPTELYDFPTLHIHIHVLNISHNLIFFFFIILI